MALNLFNIQHTVPFRQTVSRIQSQPKRKQQHVRRLNLFNRIQLTKSYTARINVTTQGGTNQQETAIGPATSTTMADLNGGTVAAPRMLLQVRHTARRHAALPCSPVHSRAEQQQPGSRTQHEPHSRRNGTLGSGMMARSLSLMPLRTWQQGRTEARLLPVLACSGICFRCLASSGQPSLYPSSSPSFLSDRC